MEPLTTVNLEREDELAIITLNRPQVHNAINKQMLRELNLVIEHLSDDDTCHVIIITGKGEVSFSSGTDINELMTLSPLGAQKYSKYGQRVINNIENLEKPVVTAVNGISLGAGIEIIMASDIAVASENAEFGWPEITLGIIPCWGGTQRLPRIVGKLKAKELIFTGRMFGPDEALRLGLLTSIIPQDRLMIEARRIAKSLSSKPITSIRKAKSALNMSAESELYTGTHLESQLFGLSFAGKEVHQLLKDWLDRKKHDS